MPGQEGVFNESLLRAGDQVCVHLIDRVADQVSLLTPSLETYHLRSTFNPLVSSQLHLFMQEVRSIFAGRGFTEILTPTLVPSPGTEPYLEPFTTEWAYGDRTRTCYLPTSPEFHLKQLLAAGWTKIYEIKTCFRNGEIGEHHEPEFQMLEWYRAYSPLDAIADDVEALLSTLSQKLRPERPVPKLRRTTMATLFAKAFNGFSLTPTTTRDDLVALAGAFSVTVDVSDSWDDLFFRLFLEKIEGTLGLEDPVLVRGYSPTQAALSRIGADGFADRFEVYWRGLELANAFHELNDPDENVARFEADRARKEELGKPAVPIDKILIAALKHGLPPSGGIAMGLDRVFMALFEYRTIGETRGFPMER